MAQPIQIGITGGIGSGKTTVCRVFACLGIPVYYADDRARWLSENHPVIRREIIALLGEPAYSPDGKYNRTFVASRVFGNDTLLNELNRIIHPRVRKDAESWVAAQKDSRYILREAAIMGKAGVQNQLDFVIVVQAPEALRIRRTLKRDPHRSREEVLAIIKSQVPDEERLKIADFVVQNDDISPVIPQVLALHRRFSGQAVKQPLSPL